MTCLAQQLRQRMRTGPLLKGGHTFLDDPAITEMLGYHGYEFVWIDGEHGSFDKKRTLDHIMAAASGGCASFVRVPWNDPVILKPILEMGPDGIIAPMVTTAEEARAFISACAYPPEGIRGYGPRRASRYGAISKETYVRTAMERMLHIVQIEHIRAVENLEAICDVPGIDLLIVGPNDLSASMGTLTDTHAPCMLPLYDRIAEVCKRKGMPFGVSIGPDDTTAMREWIARGIQVLSCGDDVSFIARGAQETLRTIRTLAGEGEEACRTQS